MKNHSSSQEPERLVCDGSSFERALLAAGRAEAPREDGLHQVLATLALGSAGSLVAGEFVRRSLFLKWSRPILLGLLAASPIVYVAASVSLAATRPVRERWHRTTSTTEDSVVLTEKQEVAPRARVEELQSKPKLLQAPMASRPTESPSLSRENSIRGRTTSSFEQEIALIEAAKSELAQKNFFAALAKVSAYQQDFPRGSFLEEADALQMDALTMAGNIEAARTYARRFIALHPKSPYRDRIERWLVTRP